MIDRRRTRGPQRRLPLSVAIMKCHAMDVRARTGILMTSAIEVSLMPTTPGSTAPSRGSRSDHRGARPFDGTPAAECKAVCVSPSHVPAVWPFAKPLIEAAMRRGGVSDFSGVERDVFSGAALLWLAWDGREIAAAAVTELTLVHGRRLCTIVACGGHDRKRWLHLLADLENFARREGCEATRIYGRRGWVRALHDYRATRVILEKEF